MHYPAPELEGVVQVIVLLITEFRSSIYRFSLQVKRCHIEQIGITQSLLQLPNKSQTVATQLLHGMEV